MFLCKILAMDGLSVSHPDETVHGKYVAQKHSALRFGNVVWVCFLLWALACLHLCMLLSPDAASCALLCTKHTTHTCLHALRVLVPCLCEHTAMREMLDTEGPYLLEVMVPHIEHVLPMIPGGATFKDIITEGDGSVEY